jgi:hypothetical protein
MQRALPLHHGAHSCASFAAHWLPQRGTHSQACLQHAAHAPSSSALTHWCGQLSCSDQWRWEARLKLLVLRRGSHRARAPPARRLTLAAAGCHAQQRAEQVDSLPGRHRAFPAPRPRLTPPPPPLPNPGAAVTPPAATRPRPAATCNWPPPGRTRLRVLLDLTCTLRRVSSARPVSTCAHGVTSAAAQQRSALATPHQSCTHACPCTANRPPPPRRSQQPLPLLLHTLPPPPPLPTRRFRG